MDLTFDDIRKDRKIAPHLSDYRKNYLSAVYYDTTDGFLRGLSAALRLRTSEGIKICTLKLSPREVGGARFCEEYECPADDIVSGLKALPHFGAPRDICQKLWESPLMPIAETKFFRERVFYESEAGSLVLSFDNGNLFRNKTSAPIRELEIELSSENPALLFEVSGYLESQYALQKDTVSKLQKALRL